MRHVIWYAALAMLAGVRICTAQTVEVATGLDGNASMPPHVAVPEHSVSPAQTTFDVRRVIVGPTGLPGVGVAGRGPSTRPAHAGRGRLIPTQFQAMVMLIPTDVRHQVTMCSDAVERKR